MSINNRHIGATIDQNDFVQIEVVNNRHIGATIDQNDFVEIEVVADGTKIFNATMPLAAFSVENLEHAIDNLNKNKPSNTKIFFADDRLEFYIDFYKQDIRIYSRQGVLPKFWFRVPILQLGDTLAKMFQLILAHIEKQK